MDNMEQSSVAATAGNEPAQSSVPTLAENFAEFYSMFLDVAKEIAGSKGLELPDDLPEPAGIAALSADTPDGYETIINTLNRLVAFVEENGLRRHSTSQEMAEFIDQQMAQGTPEAETLKKLAKIQATIFAGLEIRAQLADFIAFKQQEDVLLGPMYFKKNIVNQVGEAIEKAGFPVDGKKLIKNYLASAAKDPAKAFELLTTNPSTFAPIITKGVKEGKNHVNPEEGRAINQKLGKFLKGFKL